MKKRHLANKQTPSRVLLVCVYDTIVLSIPNELIYERFSPHGHILKILIFQKGEVTKFFLEYSALASAEQAKKHLDGAKLFETICKMNIYYSNFSSVDLKHQTTEGVSLQQFIAPQVDHYSYLILGEYPTYPIQTYPLDSYATYFNPSIEHSANPFSEIEMNLSGVSLSHESSVCNSPLRKNSQMEQSIQTNIEWLLKSEEKKESLSENKTKSSVSSSSQTYQYLVFPLLGEQLKNRQIYNVFSNFGNVSFIKQTCKHVFIKFRSCEFAALAKNYLFGYVLQGTPLSLSYVTDVRLALPLEQQYASITYFDSTFDRFTSHRSISINPPSTTLHVSSIRREACRKEVLAKVFLEFGPLIGVEILNSGPDKNMALVQFANIEDSFIAISQMHGSILSGRKIQISFTKSKLC